MQLARILADGVPRSVAVEEGIAYEVEEDWFIEHPRRKCALGLVESFCLVPSMEQPSRSVAVGLHCAAQGTENDPIRKISDELVLSLKPPSTLLGHGGIMLLPPKNRSDDEAALCLVVGRQAQRVPESRVLRYLLEDTGRNEVSHRALQYKDDQWLRGKGCDAFCSLGRWIEMELDPSDLAIWSRLNGERRQSSRTSHKSFSQAFRVSVISQVMALQLSDIMRTGTPFEVRPVKPKDVSEEIEEIDVLRYLEGAYDDRV